MAARRTSAAGAIALAGFLLVVGCGDERQDAEESEGEFEVDVVRASFPERQRLAQRSELEIGVRNAGDRTIPNVAVTVDGFNFRSATPELADAERPRFVLNGVPVEIGGFPDAKNASPRGCETVYVNTWACGPLSPGRERSFRWSVTAVRAGRFRIRWRVAGGLYGKAKAVGGGGGSAPRGSIVGSISDEAAQSRVADDGKTVVSGSR
ncbi:MAG: hypothetical protein ICV69_12605 [Thermoleophilaceae bacterium]|nr:hypothetical protein [Thermoleophilaceae bacterium]